LFRASELSLDAATANFSLRRVIPISIFIDGDSEKSDELGRRLSEEVKRALEDAEYDEAFEWGPFTGSWFTTIFGKGRAPEDAPALKRRLERLEARLKSFGKTIPEETFAGLDVVIIVGMTAIEIVGAGVIATALPFTIPIVVIEHILHVAKGAEIALAIHALIEAHRRSRGKFKF
jgi:hypothetical protein